jgi:fermentation-respiration switch protein FrsA (DUF1100 family)
MLLGVTIGVLLLLLAAYVGAAAVLADAMTRARRRRVEGTPADLGLRYEDVMFTATDGVTLQGWYLESPGARASVVLVHDSAGTRADRSLGIMTLQRDYLRRGLNVLSFDLRGRGESATVRDTFGTDERLDVDAAVEFARRRARQLPVVVHGFGFGAALALVGASQGLKVDLVIADSPFAYTHDYVRRRWRSIPRPVFDLACGIARRRFGANIDAVQPLEAVAAASPVPTLFIHGEADRIVPIAHSLNIAAASLNPRDLLWRVPGAGHCDAYRRSPDAYVSRCVNFIDSAVPARRLDIAAAG